MDIRIHAIQTGLVIIKESQRRGSGVFPKRIMTTFVSPKWAEPVPILAWVVEHPEGIIVVDTGETARTAEPGYLPSWHPYYRFAVRFQVRPEEEIGPKMQALGINPRDVRRVVMTHLHTDHAGGLHHFPKAEIMVSQREMRVASGVMGRLNGYLPNRWPVWFRPQPVHFGAQPMGPFPETLPLTSAGDVRLVSTPGHTPGHMSVVVESGGHHYFIAGDTSYDLATMMDEAIDGVSPNAAVARLTLKRIKQYVSDQGVVYLPSHDHDSATRLAAAQEV